MVDEEVFVFVTNFTCSVHCVRALRVLFISRGQIVQNLMFIIVQVEALICQHDRAPEFLSQLLDNLTLLGSYPPPPSLPSQNLSLR